MKYLVLPLFVVLGSTVVLSLFVASAMFAQDTP